MHPTLYGEMLIYAFESLACLFAALLAVISYVVLAR
jgi:hypothetical protein